MRPSLNSGEMESGLKDALIHKEKEFHASYGLCDLTVNNGVPATNILETTMYFSDHMASDHYFKEAVVKVLIKDGITSYEIIS